MSLIEAFQSLDPWKCEAACRGVDPGLFHPDDEDEIPDECRAFCQACPVKEECLRFALEHPDVEGVWAETTHRQRRVMLGLPDGRRVVCEICDEVFYAQSNHASLCSDVCRREKRRRLQQQYRLGAGS